MDFRTFYGHDRDAASCGVTFDEPSLTRQEFLKDSLTSTIMERFAKTGVLTPCINQSRIAQFGDFSEVPNDLLDAHTRLSNVSECFSELPAALRAQFGNSPLAFVKFLSDPRNKSKAIEMGLLPSEKPVVPEKPIVPVKPVEGETTTTSENKEIK